jgi:hypothetical protein
LGVAKALDALQAVAASDAEKVIRVTLIGAFSSGKSTLTNALLGERVLPGHHKPTTAVPTTIRHSPEYGMRVHLREGWKAHKGLQTLTKRSSTRPPHLSLGSLKQTEVRDLLERLTTVDASAQGPSRHIEALEVLGPFRLLEPTQTGKRLEVVDTPGLYDPSLIGIGDRSERTRQHLEQVDLALFLLDPTCDHITQQDLQEVFLDRLAAPGSKDLRLIIARPKKDALEPGALSLGELEQQVRAELTQALRSVSVAAAATFSRIDFVEVSALHALSYASPQEGLSPLIALLAPDWDNGVSTLTRLLTEVRDDPHREKAQLDQAAVTVSEALDAILTKVQERILSETEALDEIERESRNAAKRLKRQIDRFSAELESMLEEEVAWAQEELQGLEEPLREALQKLLLSALSSSTTRHIGGELLREPWTRVKYCVNYLFWHYDLGPLRNRLQEAAFPDFLWRRLGLVCEEAPAHLDTCRREAVESFESRARALAKQYDICIGPVETQAKRVCTSHVREIQGKVTTALHGFIPGAEATRARCVLKRWQASAREMGGSGARARVVASLRRSARAELERVRDDSLRASPVFAEARQDVLTALRDLLTVMKKALEQEFGKRLRRRFKAKATRIRDDRVSDLERNIDALDKLQRELTDDRARLPLVAIPEVCLVGAGQKENP